MSNTKLSINEMLSKVASSGSSISQKPSVSEVRFFEQEMERDNNKTNVNSGVNKKPEENKKPEGDKNVKDILNKLEDKMDILANQLKHMAIGSGKEDALKELQEKVGLVSGEEQLVPFAVLTPEMLMSSGMNGNMDVNGISSVQGVQEIQLNELVQQIIATAPTDHSKGEVRITLAQVFPGTQISLQRNDEGMLMVNFLASGAAAYQQISNVQETLKRRLEIIEGKDVVIEVSDNKSSTATQVQDTPIV